MAASVSKCGRTWVSGPSNSRWISPPGGSTSNDSTAPGSNGPSSSGPNSPLGRCTSVKRNASTDGSQSLSRTSARVICASTAGSSGEPSTSTLMRGAGIYLSGGIGSGSPGTSTSKGSGSLEASQMRQKRVGSR